MNVNYNWFTQDSPNDGFSVLPRDGASLWTESQFIRYRSIYESIVHIEVEY